MRRANNAPLVYYLYAILVVILKSNINKSRFAAGNNKLRLCFYLQSCVCSREVVFAKKLNSIIELAQHISFVVLAMLDSTSSACCLFSPLLLYEQQVTVPVGREQQAGAPRLALSSCQLAGSPIRH